MRIKLTTDGVAKYYITADNNIKIVYLNISIKICAYYLYWRIIMLRKFPTLPTIDYLYKSQIRPRYRILLPYLGCSYSIFTILPCFQNNFHGLVRKGANRHSLSHRQSRISISWQRFWLDPFFSSVSFELQTLFVMYMYLCKF